MARPVCQGIVAFVAAVLLLTLAVAEERVAPPLSPELARAVLGKPDHAAFDCPPPVPPVTDMSVMLTPYDLKDPTQSKLDPKRTAQGAARYNALIQFAGQIETLADRFMISNPPDQAIARCAIDRLRAWADAEALLANVDDNNELGRHQAIMMQAWNLAGYASSFAKLGRAADLSETDRSAILAWFRKLADSVQHGYTGDNRWTRATNNHLYWAAFSVGVAGAVLNDRSRFEFAMKALDRGLSEVAANGTLPKELARGGRAMMYQNFAALPLAGLVALADANGRQLSADQEAALERLISFNSSQACDPRLASQLAGVEQPKTADHTNLAWADAVLPHIDRTDPPLAASLDALVAGIRPLSHPYFGGNVSAAYNPQALVARGASGHPNGAMAAPC